MDMRFRTPTSAGGWVSLGIVAVVIVLGIWPVVVLFDRNVLVLGMPLLMVWSIAILFITTIAMVIINRITGDLGDVNPLDPNGTSVDAGQPGGEGR